MCIRDSIYPLTLTWCATYIRCLLSVMGLKTLEQAALGAADTSPVAPRAASKYLGGELRVKSDVGTTSVSIAFASPPGSDSSERDVLLL